MNKTRKTRLLFDHTVLRQASVEALRRLSPRQQIRNPVMFVVEIGSLLTTILFIQALAGDGEMNSGYILAISAWLWFTVIFANFAEAVAEGRGKAQRNAVTGGNAEAIPPRPFREKTGRHRGPRRPSDRRGRCPAER